MVGFFPPQPCYCCRCYGCCFDWTAAATPEIRDTDADQWVEYYEDGEDDTVVVEVVAWQGTENEADSQCLLHRDRDAVIRNEDGDDDDTVVVAVVVHSSGTVQHEKMEDNMQQQQQHPDEDYTGDDDDADLSNAVEASSSAGAVAVEEEYWNHGQEILCYLWVLDHHLDHDLDHLALLLPSLHLVGQAHVSVHFRPGLASLAAGS